MRLAGQGGDNDDDGGDDGDAGKKMKREDKTSLGDIRCPPFTE